MRTRRVAHVKHATGYSLVARAKSPRINTEKSVQIRHCRRRLSADLHEFVQAFVAHHAKLALKSGILPLPRITYTITRELAGGENF